MAGVESVFVAGSTSAPVVDRNALISGTSR